MARLHLPNKTQKDEESRKNFEAVERVVNANANPWPVGSIYQSVVSTSPDTLFGGTWESLADKFLVGKGTGTFATAGTTGGAEAVTLDLTQIPSHRHTVAVISTTAGATVGGTGSAYQATANTGYVGGGLAHENLPPYQVVYMWKRVA